MEGKSISVKVFALIILAAGIVGYFLSTAIRAGIQLPVAALAISGTVFLIVPFSELKQREISPISALAFLASFIWLLTKLSS